MGHETSPRERTALVRTLGPADAWSSTGLLATRIPAAATAPAAHLPYKAKYFNQLVRDILSLYYYEFDNFSKK
jgi:hypothetical protein